MKLMARVHLRPSESIDSRLMGIAETKFLTVLTYTKLFITNNNYTYAIISQYHCDVIIH